MNLENVSTAALKAELARRESGPVATKPVTDADIQSAQEYLAGASSRHVLLNAVTHLRREVIAEMVVRKLLPDYVKHAHDDRYGVAH